MLSKTQAQIIKKIAGKERTLADIARLTGFSKPYAMSQLGHLEEMGWVSRKVVSPKKIFYEVISEAEADALLAVTQKKLLADVYTQARRPERHKKLKLVAGFSLDLLPEQRTRLESDFDFTEYPERHEQITEELFRLRYRSADIALVEYSFTFITADTLRACPNLKYLIAMSKWSDTYFDKKLCEEAGIQFFDLSDPEMNYIRSSSTEFLLGSIFSILRNTIQAEQELLLSTQALVVRNLQIAGEELLGKTVGIVGVENSGRFVAPLLQQLGAKTMFVDPDNKKYDPREWGVDRFYSLEDTFALADIVVYTDNYHKKEIRLDKLISEKMSVQYLLVLGEYPYTKEFVAACRSAILKQALRGLHLEYWPNHQPKLDITRSELLSELRFFPNVRITPAMGPVTRESVARRNDYTIGILESINEKHYA